MQKLFIVCGLIGAGKTVIANSLSKKLNIACISKDTIKENLFDLLEGKNIDDSERIGKYSILLLYKMVETQIANGVDLIIEAPFYFEEDYKIFKRWETTYNIQIYTIICSVAIADRLSRITNRKRHNAHFDLQKASIRSNSEEVYKTIPGKKIKIVTNIPVTKNIEKIIAQL